MEERRWRNGDGGTEMEERRRQTGKVKRSPLQTRSRNRAIALRKAFSTYALRRVIATANIIHSPPTLVTHVLAWRVLDSPPPNLN